MGNNKLNQKLRAKSKKNIAIISVVILVAIMTISIINNKSGTESTTSSSLSEDLKIPISEVTEKAKFYPITVDGTKMEVVALKASDGTIRTALNTCQVCNNSGRGYYVQEGDVLICQNCGNRFQADQVELIKGGCNPVPIMKENKTDDGTNITISKDFLAQNKDLFANWKTE